VSEPNLNLRFRIMFIGLGVISAAALVISAWALYARFTQSNAYRAADVRIWSAVICQIEKSVVIHHKHLSPTRVRGILRFYDRLLIVDVQTAGCGLAGRVR